MQQFPFQIFQQKKNEEEIGSEDADMCKCWKSCQPSYLWASHPLLHIISLFINKWTLIFFIIKFSKKYFVGVSMSINMLMSYYVFDTWRCMIINSWLFIASKVRIILRGYIFLDFICLTRRLKSFSVLTRFLMHSIFLRIFWGIYFSICGYF